PSREAPAAERMTLGWLATAGLVAGALIAGGSLEPLARGPLMLASLCAGFRIVLHFAGRTAGATEAVANRPGGGGEPLATRGRAGAAESLPRALYLGACNLLLALALPWLVSLAGWFDHGPRTQGWIGVISGSLIAAAAGHWVVAFRRWRGIPAKPYFQ